MLIGNVFCPPVGRHIEFAVHKGGLNIKGFESGEWYMTGNHTTTGNASHWAFA